MAILDVGLPYPTAQTRLRDAQVPGDLHDRLLPPPSQLDRTTAELEILECSHDGLLSERIIASDSVSEKREKVK